jgi:hypothetical protein
MFKYVFMLMNKVIPIALLFFSLLSGYAQTVEDEVTDNIFRGTRLVNEHSANMADRGQLLFLIQHRFGEIDGGLYELFGLDQATMRMGFEYGFGNNLTAGFGRSSWLKTYDLFIKARFAEQHQNFPLTISAVAQASVPTLRNYFPETEDKLFSKSAGSIQLILSKIIGNIGIHLSPGVLSTGYLHSQNENILLFTAGIAGSVRISDMVSAHIEYLPSFHSEYSPANPLSFGVDIDTRGHLFQLILSNSQQMFTHGLYTATQGSWSEGQIYFGFNLIREFRIKYY